jgi:hypothetical protein
LISVGSEVQVLPGPPELLTPACCLLRMGNLGGHSSAGRAPALQAGGHRFESGCLHYSRSASAEMDVKRSSPGSSNSRLRRSQLYRVERSRDRGGLVLQQEHRRRVNRQIGDFVLCQGESGSGASLGACDGSGILSRVRPVVRLMSDRESVSGMAMPVFGFCGRACAPKSDSEGSEACV